jgi:hypothetical protein
MDGKHKEPTANMKTVLLDLLNVVRTYDDGKAGKPHDVTGIHHMTLKAMAKADYGKLILLDASYSNSPIKLIWTVAITRYGLQVAKKLERNGDGINSTGNKSSRKRITIQVQLDESKHAETIKGIEAMKGAKGVSYTKFVVQSVALEKELKAGQFDLFKQLYPEAYANILMSEMLQEWKRFADTPRNTNTGANSSEPPVQREKVHDDGTDDVDIEITVDANAGKIANQNFLRTTFGLLEEKEVVPVAPEIQLSPRKLDVPQFEVPNFDED